MKRKWSLVEKARAKQLRLEGNSFKTIIAELGVPKSTLFVWLGKRSTSFVKNPTGGWTTEVRSFAAEANRKKRIDRQERIKFETAQEIASISHFSLEFKRGLLAMLYWTEGAKSGQSMQFVNIDPKLHLLFVTLLRECYLIDERKFRVRLHLHYYHKARRSTELWSNLLNIPKDKFGKIYWKKRSKEKAFRRNEAGICTVRYNSVELQEQLLGYAHALGERLAPVAQWIE